MQIVTFALFLIGLAALVGHAVYFVWASFHTAPGTSQTSALFLSWTCMQPERYTERGQELLRRMWICLGVCVVALVMTGVSAAAIDEYQRAMDVPESAAQP